MLAKPKAKNVNVNQTGGSVQAGLKNCLDRTWSIWINYIHVLDDPYEAFFERLLHILGRTAMIYACKKDFENFSLSTKVLNFSLANWPL